MYNNLRRKESRKKYQVVSKGKGKNMILEHDLLTVFFD